MRVRGTVVMLFLTCAFASQVLSDIVRSAGIRCMICEPWRYQAHFRALKRKLDEGVIGEVISVRHLPADARLMRGNKLGPDAWDGAGTPLLKHRGRQWLDTARFLLGDPAAVFCRTRQVNEELKGEDTVHVTIEFPGDVIYRMDASYSAFPPPDRGPELTVEGTRGTLTLGREPYFSLELVPRPGVSYPLSYVVPADPYQEAVDLCLFRALAALKTGSRFETELDDNLKTLKLVDAAYRSAAEDGAPVDLS